jgi:hypothetical protein
VEDVATLARTPLVLKREAWCEVQSLASQLAAETIAAERAILAKPRLLRRLAIPWLLRRKLPSPDALARSAPSLRLIRFDFHFTPEGWKISEANTDVPGGMNEASGFCRLMSRHYGETTVAGDPAQAICDAIARQIPAGGAVALLHATAYCDDRQVMTFLANRLSAAGYRPLLIAPDHLCWDDGRARCIADWAAGPVDFCFRFFPAEWLPALPRRCRWHHLLGESRTPLCNPALALISQSKRFPLVWDELPVAMSAWRTLLPQTFDVRDRACRRAEQDSLVFKPALGRVGDMIKMAGLCTEKESRDISRAIRRFPRRWIAQRKFETLPVETADGNVYPCLGVYTLHGQVIGAYGRVARTPLINHLAQDAAVLIAQPSPSHSSPETAKEPEPHHELLPTV